MNEQIYYTLIIMTVIVTVSYLNKGSAKAIAFNKEQYLLRVNKLYFYIGLFTILTSFVFAIVPPLVDPPDTAMLVAIFFMLLVFGGLGIKLILLYRNHYLLFDEEFVQVRDQKGVVTSTDWDKLQTASFNTFSGYLILSTITGSKLKVHQHLVGISKFMEGLEAKKGWTSSELRFPVK
jgi:hypothetical protein